MYNISTISVSIRQSQLHPFMLIQRNCLRLPSSKKQVIINHPSGLIAAFHEILTENTLSNLVHEKEIMYF